MQNTGLTEEVRLIAERIHEMREIIGFSVDEMAEKTNLTAETYSLYESGKIDLPFTFIHKCAQAFGIGITDILEGHSAHLSSYTVTRKGQGTRTAKEDGIEISNLAPLFRNKLAEPYWVKYEYSEELQNKEIHTTTHGGQEFDLVLSGTLKVRVGDHTEVLEEGDSIYYKSSTPHGMIAMNGKDCLFLAVVISGDETVDEKAIQKTVVEARTAKAPLAVENFVEATEDGEGKLVSMKFKNEDSFNFAYDVVDAIAEKTPNKLAMLHVSKDKTERRFTFRDMKHASARTANYLKSLGIKKGDTVMVVLKRHYQFWFTILALHKLGAIAIPATHQLLEHDFEYRFKAAHVKAIVCTADDNTPDHVDAAAASYGDLKVKVLVGGNREGWHNFDEEYAMFRGYFPRTEETACGADPMLMFFTSGTTGYPKIACHNYKYALGHYITAKYWHYVHSDGLHFTISDTGWGKALWGKLYGQWMCEGAVFTYDFDRFDASEILPMFKKYNITTFCAPPTMYRMFIKQDLSAYDLSSIQYATTAGEALNPEVFTQFKKATGLTIMEGFGQTETTLTIANLYGTRPKPGAMGKAVPTYDIDLVDTDGNKVKDGEPGEIVVRTDKEVPCGLFMGYYNDEEQTKEAWHDGMYHTGDVAWRDEDGYFWYVSRVDDVIKSSGYRIGPFEIENVIMELPYVLECGVCAAPDEVRGQVVKACIVLTNGTEGTDELKKEIQSYVKTHTAPYKYPRIVEFRDELPKTISGKIIRNKL
ncbi:MAG: AMP-binding protein [Clostridia bacterium]|nr:AMP-binding protein [Clostridia bacterium]